MTVEFKIPGFSNLSYSNTYIAHFWKTKDSLLEINATNIVLRGERFATAFQPLWSSFRFSSILYSISVACYSLKVHREATLSSNSSHCI